MVKLVHQRLLVFRQCIGIAGVDGGEATGFHLIFLAIHDIDFFLEINILQHTSVEHSPFGMFVEELGFHLELKHGDGLVHLCRQPCTLGIHFLCTATRFRNEYRAGVVLVGLHCECGQWYEVDAVAFLDSSEIGIAEREANYVADTCVVTSGCTHP